MAIISAGFYFAAGFKNGQPTGGFGFYAEALYRVLGSTVEVKEDEVTIKKKEIDMNGFGGNLGIVFRF